MFIPIKGYIWQSRGQVQGLLLVDKDGRQFYIPFGQSIDGPGMYIPWSPTRKGQGPQFMQLGYQRESGGRPILIISEFMGELCNCSFEEFEDLPQRDLTVMLYLKFEKEDGPGIVITLKNIQRSKLPQTLTFSKAGIERPISKDQVYQFMVEVPEVLHFIPHKPEE